MELKDDLPVRWKRVQLALKGLGADACIIASNTNLYYLSGMIFGGYIYMPAGGDPIYFVRRPLGLEDPKVIYIRKPEDIPSFLKERRLEIPRYILLEADQLTYSDYVRLQSVFNPEQTGNATSLLRKIRSVKTDWEIDQLRISAKKHAEAYEKIKECYSPGIKDVQFQANIERVMRSLGSIGIFRGYGSNMDIYMGSLLAGDNAEIPSPFDFALGGGGMDASIPVGANGTMLKEGISVMVDMVGNYTAYLTDMTRTFAVGHLPDIAYKAHQVSLDIQRKIMETGRPGASCADMYKLSLEMAGAAGLADYFMGTKQQAKFVGHGVGIEINELPVLMEHSKDVLEPNVVFALEPKFVLPGIGAVGIENTFLVKENGLEKLTVFDEEIVIL